MNKQATNENISNCVYFVIKIDRICSKPTADDDKSVKLKSTF